MFQTIKIEEDFLTSRIVIFFPGAVVAGAGGRLSGATLCRLPVKDKL